MPADFGDITAYARQEATRHYALAQAARDRQSFGEAEYLAGLAARWDEAARQQNIEMRHEPIPSRADQRPIRRAPEPIPFTFAGLLTVLRGV